MHKHRLTTDRNDLENSLVHFWDLFFLKQIHNAEVPQQMQRDYAVFYGEDAFHLVYNDRIMVYGENGDKKCFFYFDILFFVY